MQVVAPAAQASVENTTERPAGKYSGSFSGDRATEITRQRSSSWSA
ncbi:hypothetical protein P1S61_11690 [Streptomyces sp. ME08-AFT2]|nr:hypothetical protein [Streptomyces sp. ME08-AFT2]MDX3309745.1 hypothetical protein [Streptomyces sp. ME08-AFT2]